MNHYLFIYSTRLLLALEDCGPATAPLPSPPPHLASLSVGMLLFRHFYSALLLLPLLGRPLLAAAAPSASDPCAKVAGLQFVDPADAIACQRSFPFDEGLRQNVLSVVSRVFDFYTFEDFYFSLPWLFRESRSNIRSQIKRISTTRYDVSIPFMPLILATHPAVTVPHRATIVSTWLYGTSRIS
jgi:hypothetical protein